MQDETGHHDDGVQPTSVGPPPQGVGVAEVVAVPALRAWTVRVTVPHGDGPASGWAPEVFWSPVSAQRWIAARAQRQLRPAVRECDHGPHELAYAAVLDEHGTELLVSQPLRRVKAAGVAALLAAELRSRRQA